MGRKTVKPLITVLKDDQTVPIAQTFPSEQGDAHKFYEIRPPTDNPKELYEYKVVSSGKDKLEEILNTYAKQGYKLDQLVVRQYNDILVFSRIKKNQEP